MKRVTSFFLAILLLFSINNVAFAQQEDVTVKGIGAFEVKENSLLLKWDETKGAYGYKIYMQNDKSSKYEFYTASFETECEIKDLEAAKLYRFKISALTEKSDGKVSESKKSNALTALTAPGKVPYVVTDDIGKDYISFSWKKGKGAQFYEVWFYSKEKGDYSLLAVTEQRAFTKAGLKKDSVYSFKIRPIASKEDAIAYGEYTYHYDFTYTEDLPYTNSQAARYYNDNIYSAKEREAVKVTHKKSVETQTYSTSKYSLLRTVKNMMSVFSGSVKNTYTVKEKEKENVLMGVIEPLNKNSQLKGDYIKSFDFDFSEDKLTLKLKLKAEQTSFTDKKTEAPFYHSSVLKKVNIHSLKTSPLEIKKGTSFFEGADITADFVNGAISNLRIKNKVKVTAQLKVSTVDFTAEVGYTVNDSYVFKNIKKVEK